jgi:hypothetical protein
MRETQSFATPGGHTVVINAYISGRESNAIKQVLYDDLKMNMKDAQNGAVAMDDLPSSFVVKQEEKAIELIVVSIDGSSEDVIQRVLDLPVAEYNAIVEEVNKVRRPTKPGSSVQLGNGTSEAAL